MTLAAGARLGSYVITGALGAGGMGEVYRAKDARLGREVAIKVLPEAFTSDPERLARFEREAKVLAALNHPNIATLHGFEEQNGVRALVMELVEGETLADHLARGPLPADELVPVFLQIAEALEYAHARGIVHRDLKPANVKLLADGKVKVLDFGLAKALEAAPGAAAASDLAHSPTLTYAPTVHGMILGTAAYMAPEQAKGKPVDQRADIWAFGVLLYEGLTGRRLFAGETVPEILAQVLATGPDLGALPDGTPQRLRELLRRCLVRDPRHRLQAIGDARVELEEVLARPQEAVAAPAAARRSPVVIAAALLAAVAAGVAIGYFALPRRGSAESAAVSFQRLTFRPGHFINARFAPDGQTVFYSAAWEGRPREIFQARPGGGELALGLVGHELLAVSRSGELALLLPRIRGANPYVKRGTLARVPASGGTPRELAEDVTGADLSADGKTFAVIRESTGGRRLEFPLGSTLYETSNRLFWPRISPSGDSVAFFEADGAATSVVMVSAAGARRVLSGGWADWWNLAWSASGREVWFGAAKAGTAAALYAVDLEGKVRPLLAAPATIELHDVAADGRSLVARVGFRLHVFGRGPGATEERNLSWHEASQAAGLSADGRWLLLDEQSETEGGGAWAYLRSTDGAAPVRLGQGGPQELSADGKWALAIRGSEIVALPTGPGEARSVSTRFAGIDAARWLPDGERIVVAASEPGAGTRLYVMGFGTQAPRATGGEFILGTQGRGHQPLTVSPDGRSVALADAGGGIRIVALESGESRQLAGIGPNELPIQWTADGRSLYVYDPGELPARISKVELAGGRRTPWLEIAIRDPAGVYGIERLHMTTDGKSYAYSYGHFLSDLYLVEGLR